MAQKAPYKTRQHDELMAYLESNPGKHITAGDVCGHFRSCGQSIGTATVYRQLEKMVDAGLVAKYTVDSGSSACFEYLGRDHGDVGEICYHCKCEHCGRLFHMHCHELPGLQEHIRQHHGFTVDPMRTVFYGTCAACSAEAAEDRI